MGVFRYIKQGIRIQYMALFIDMAHNTIILTLVYKGSQLYVDILQANSVTSQVKHTTV